MEHVLLGFDIDTCCIGYDGEIICTERFMRSIRYGYNLVDTTRLSTSYENRIMKYLVRGFSIAMIEPTIKTTTQRISELIKKYKKFELYSIFHGIYKLSYLLVKYFEYRLRSKINLSEYGYNYLHQVINQLKNGIEKTNFIYGMDLDAVLFKGISDISEQEGGRRKTQFERYIHKNINKETILPPIRIFKEKCHETI